MTFKELATRRFSVRKYTDEPVSNEEAVAIVPIAPDCPQADKKRKDLNEIFEEV